MADKYKEIIKGYYKSPIGIIEIKAVDDLIISVEFANDDSYKVNENSKILEKALKQLDLYFKGDLKAFDVNMFLDGTEFQKKVWNELTKIPYGEIVTYKDIAKSIGNEKAVRAVGNANNKNKIPIIIPCHRVIGSNGKLIGYAGELWRKEWLLKHEKTHNFSKM